MNRFLTKNEIIKFIGFVSVALIANTQPVKSSLPSEMGGEIAQRLGEEDLKVFGQVCTDFKKCAEEARTTRKLHIIPNPIFN